MAADVFAFPFRMEGTNFKKVEQGTDEEKAQLISLFVQTTKGERPIIPDYGVEDFLFGDLDPDDIGGEFAIHHDAEDVQIDEVFVEETQGAISAVHIEFS